MTRSKYISCFTNSEFFITFVKKVEIWCPWATKRLFFTEVVVKIMKTSYCTIFAQAVYLCFLKVIYFSDQNFGEPWESSRILIG